MYFFVNGLSSNFASWASFLLPAAIIVESIFVILTHIDIDFGNDFLLKILNFNDKKRLHKNFDEKHLTPDN